MTTQLSTGARNALVAVIVLLLGAGLVAALTARTDGDGGDGASVAIDTTTSPTIGDTTPAPADTVAPAPADTVAPDAAGAPVATSAPAVAPASPGVTSPPGTSGAQSGLSAEGAGDVAGGPPVIADTGGESLLGLGVLLAAVAAVARRLSRT